jgi:hypothetical protein
MAILNREKYIRKRLSVGQFRWCAFRRISLPVLLLMMAASVEAAGIGEYQVKAAMVYNVTKYVEWAGDSANAPAATLNLCLVGKGALETAIEPLQGLEAKGKKILVRKLARTDDLSACQILVLGEMEKRQLVSALEAATEEEILTVSDLPRFAANGGIIGLVAEGGRIRFEINLTAAKRSKIKISSQLLKLARIVSGEER